MRRIRACPIPAHTPTRPHTQAHASTCRWKTRIGLPGRPCLQRRVPGALTPTPTPHAPPQPYRNYFFGNLGGSGVAGTPDSFFSPSAAAAGSAVAAAAPAGAGARPRRPARAPGAPPASLKGALDGDRDREGFGRGQEELMFVLSMGHRIHLLAYDPAQVRPYTAPIQPYMSPL